MKRKWGFTEALLHVQLVAEGSLSNRRALGVAMARARWNNTEGSAIQYNQRNDSVKTKENASTFEVFKVVISQMRTHMRDII